VSYDRDVPLSESDPGKGVGEREAFLDHGTLLCQRATAGAGLSAIDDAG
jgi:hypothetical protein